MTALTVARNIFTPPTAPGGPLGYAGTAPQQIANGANITIAPNILYGYQTGDETVASKDLGIYREQLQEAIHDQARSDYNNYRDTKKARLEGIRSEAINNYAAKYRRMIVLGFSEDEARKSANELARGIYKNLMEEWKVMYPSLHSGKEVIKEIY